MGQYFHAVNVSKQEYVNAWDIGGYSKLWEWCASNSAGIFPYLLRKSNDRGGGDVRAAEPQYAGRWAGDEVYLVGDYDTSELFARAERTFTNISQPLAKEYNAFIGLAERQLEVRKA